MAQDLQMAAYCKFWSFYTSEYVGGCSLVSYEKYKTEQTRTMGFFYDSMERDYTREIINALNRFAHEIDVVKIWSNYIFPKYSEDEQFELSYYFLELPLYYCLNQPQSIRDRLIFCATHLCHQANRIKIPEYKDDLPEDWKIKKPELIKRAKSWNSNANFLKALNDVACDNFKKKTFNYRNMAHHQIPPSLEYGTATSITRTRTAKGVSYGLGGAPALKSIDLIDDLKQELELLKMAFEAYWAMILEHYEYSKTTTEKYTLCLKSK
jgi:hypothetical protein